MTRCGRMRRWMVEAVDGRLDAARDAELRAHVARCDDCRVAMEGMERAARAVRELGQVDVPAGFGAAVRARIEAEGERSPWAWRVWWEMPGVRMGLAAAFLAVLAGYGYVGLGPMWRSRGEADGIRRKSGPVVRMTAIRKPKASGSQAEGGGRVPASSMPMGAPMAPAPMVEGRDSFGDKAAVAASPPARARELQREGSVSARQEMLWRRSDVKDVDIVEAFGETQPSPPPADREESEVRVAGEINGDASAMRETLSSGRRAAAVAEEAPSRKAEASADMPVLPVAIRVRDVAAAGEIVREIVHRYGGTPALAAGSDERDMHQEAGAGEPGELTSGGLVVDVVLGVGQAEAFLDGVRELDEAGVPDATGGGEREKRLRKSDAMFSAGASGSTVRVRVRITGLGEGR